MKKLIIIFSAMLALTSFVTVNTWHNDKAHSQLAFTVTHLGVSDVSGTFNDFDVTVTTTTGDFSDAVFELNAKSASINTRIDARDNHLRSADFFDVEKYPAITYRSTQMKKTGKDTYELTGDLTMHGITKPVTMELVYRGTIDHPMSKAKVAGFQLTGTIDRTQFDIGPGFPPPMISNEVIIKADGEFTIKSI